MLPNSSAAIKPVTDPEKQRRSLRRFLGYVRPYQSVLSVAIVCGVVRYLIPLVLPWSVKVLIDDFLLLDGTRPHIQLHFLMSGLCALYLVYAVVSYWRSYLSGLAGHRVIFDLRQALYLHLQRMSLTFFERQKIGEVVSRLTTDIASAQNFVGAAFINTIMDLSCLIFIIAVLFSMHFKLAMVSMAVLPFYAWVSFSMKQRIRATSRSIHQQLQEISGDLHEQFGGISAIQAFTQEEAEAQAFKMQSEHYFGTVMDNVKLQAIALGATGFLTSLGPILVLWFGASEVWDAHLSVGALMAFYGYLGLLYQPLQRLTELNLILANSLAAMDRIFDVFDICPEVQEKPQAKTLAAVQNGIRFDAVSFGYNKDQAVLHELNLEIRLGATVAMIGPSGAGKSTLAKLLLRYYDVTGGSIRIDGSDIREFSLKSLRQQIALVSQDPILFSGTVAENLRYGKPKASQEEMHQAAKAAFADTFIEQLPQGYETYIGERGLRLSGGQKQRLAIARAFLKDAPILILDEPTSALDAESEELIKQALARLLKSRACLIIAHRLSTIEHADTVVVLQDGRIIERGPHAELLRNPDGLYRRYALLHFAQQA